MAYNSISIMQLIHSLPLCTQGGEADGVASFQKSPEDIGQACRGHYR